MASRRMNHLNIDLDDFFGDDDISKNFRGRSDETKEKLKQIEDNLRAKGINMDLSESFGLGNRR